MRVFLALGRHGSLSAAARALSVNHATIARRIQSLEDRLGDKLRAMYDDIVDQGVPDRFSTLLKQFDDPQGKQGE